MTATALHIAIDASRITRARATGTEHYALQLLRHLILLNDARATPHRLTLYFRDAPAANLLPESAHVLHRVIPLARLWTHLRFADALRRDPPDVTFVPAHTLPFVFPGRAVVTVHDLGYRYFPQAHPAGQRLYLDVTTRMAARRATRILADSQATADDLQRLYQVPAGKIRVVYPGVAAPDAEYMLYGNIQRVQQKYRLPDKYVLFLGTLQPRKNILRLVQAFERWQQAHEDGTALVLAGSPGWLYDPDWVRGVANIHLTGYVDDADKPALYAGALALLFPSLYEGFGFPVLEAMHCGTPVIASSTSSLPELVGDAGLLVNPQSVNDIAAALDLIGWHGALRRELRQKGFRQAEKFTWEATARQALAVLEEAAG
ncbi:MAG: glycosyltransferase family 4 protein [Anaerolineae bacterium]|nr:glycosyltransferase family 4 protein [Anaerolineae bacterium]